MVEQTAVEEDACKLDYRSISCNYFFDPRYWDGCSEHSDTRRHKEREAEGQSGREKRTEREKQEDQQLRERVTLNGHQRG